MQILWCEIHHLRADSSNDGELVRGSEHDTAHKACGVDTTAVQE
jgi:hypothetical protein